MKNNLTLLTASWCGPCRAVKEEIERNGYTVEVLDVDKHREAASEYGVRGIPTLVVFNDQSHELITGVHPILEKLKEEHKDK